MRKDYFNSYSKRGGIRRIFRKKRLLIYIFLGLLALYFIAVIAVVIITRDLPSPDNIIKNTRYSTTLLDRNNKVIYQVFEDKNIIPIDINDVPKTLINATVAIEDKDFFKHQGFSPIGILRALIKDIIFNTSEGGSTMTQQLVKNTLLTKEKTFTRKIKEFVLAIETERRFNKNQILEMYFNQTPYGGAAYGVEAASQLYFGKSVKKLSLLESAVIAGLPQSPSIYSPYIGIKDSYKKRTKQVLRRMREDRYISKQEEIDLGKQIDKGVSFKKGGGQIPAPHFVFYVKKILKEMVADENLYSQGFVIKTTLDLDLQKKAENIIEDEIAKSKSLQITNGALVAVEPKTGDVLAMVGSVDYENNKFGKFNAALGLRQPGSTLKPFTYALAFEKGLTASSVLMDVKTEFSTGKESGRDDDKPYVPENYDGKFRGPIQLRFALGSSLNIPAVKALAIVGLPDFLQKVSDAGLTTLSPSSENLKRFGLSLTLGGGEVTLLDLVTAYSTFANAGNVRPINVIKEVRNYEGKLIFKPKATSQKSIFSKEIAFLISHILSDNNARLLTFGANSYLNVPGKTVAVKTGTTDDKRDNWTVGFTKDIALGVWVGNNDNSKMNQLLASGISGAAPIWNRTIQYALTKYQDNFVNKGDILEAKEIDAFFGGLPFEDVSRRTEYFVKGTEPKTTSPFYKKLKLAKGTNKLANQYEISSGNYEEKPFYVVLETDPLSLDGKNRWQEAIDSWAREQADNKWHVPGEISTNDNESIAIQVSFPEDKKKYDNNELSILAKVSSVSKVSSFKFYINNDLKKETTDSVIDEKVKLDNGIYVIKFYSKNEKNKETEKTITVGINIDPLPTVTISPTNTVAPTESQ